ncbi:MAG: hypothetical protein CME70_23835 [Halobacteriovorax sp.]|nr:hypothetical protein [Halobacteriovorax sp.]
MLPLFIGHILKEKIQVRGYFSRIQILGARKMKKILKKRSPDLIFYEIQNMFLGWREKRS